MYSHFSGFYLFNATVEKLKSSNIVFFCFDYLSPPLNCPAEKGGEIELLPQTQNFLSLYLCTWGWYLKLGLFDLTEFIVWTILGLPLDYKDIGHRD